jgi:hypothetical protein
MSPGPASERTGGRAARSAAGGAHGEAGVVLGPVRDHPPLGDCVQPTGLGCVRATLPSNGIRKAERVTPCSLPELLGAEGAELAFGIEAVSVHGTWPAAHSLVGTYTNRLDLPDNQIIGLVRTYGRCPAWVVYITR